MGITYYIFNHTKKEFLRPINGWKAWEIIANHPGLCEVFMYSMLRCWGADWNGCRIEAIGDPDWDDIRLERYKDITTEAIIAYNSEFLEWPRCGPKAFREHIIIPSKCHIEDNAKAIIALEEDLKNLIHADLKSGTIDWWHGWPWSKEESRP